MIEPTQNVVSPESLNVVRITCCQCNAVCETSLNTVATMSSPLFCPICKKVEFRQPGSGVDRFKAIDSALKGFSDIKDVKVDFVITNPLKPSTT